MLKNIIFDLGGVLFDVNYQATADAFKEIGGNGFEKLFSKKQQSDLFDHWEIGAITPNEFRNEIRKTIQLDLSDQEIDQAWNRMLLGLRIERMSLVEKLKDNYRVFLLSNNNEIHFNALFHMIEQEHGFNTLDTYFEKTYYSHQIGKRKPNANAFEFVLDENNLIAEETLFIDDSPQHVEGAQKIGIHGYHLPTGETVLDGKLEEKINALSQ